MNENDKNNEELDAQKGANTKNMTVVQSQAVIKGDMVTKENLELMVSNAQALVDYHKRVRQVAISGTNERDWMKFGDTYRNVETGVKKILQLIGASITDMVPSDEVVTEKDGYVKKNYMVTGKIKTFDGKVFENVGTSCSKDDFFAKRKYSADNKEKGIKKGDSYYLNLDEINLNNVKKKAFTNLQYRLLNTAFVMNPDAEELKKGGLDPAKIGKVNYGKGTTGGSTDSKDEKDLRGKLKDLVAKFVANFEKNEKGIVQWATSFKVKDGDDFQGYSSVDKISVKMLKKAHTKISAEYAKAEAALDDGKNEADKLKDESK